MEHKNLFTIFLPLILAVFLLHISKLLFFNIYSKIQELTKPITTLKIVLMNTWQLTGNVEKVNTKKGMLLISVSLLLYDSYIYF